MRRRPSGDGGSTIPLILGVFLIAMLMVAGSVAAGEAFVQQRDLQSVCDGAAAAAASSADVNSERRAGLSGDSLVLAGVQDAVDTYLGRDPSRSAVHVDAALSPDRQSVSLSCRSRSKIAFGAVFGKGAGVEHHTTSAARAPLS